MLEKIDLSKTMDKKEYKKRMEVHALLFCGYFFCLSPLYL